MHLLLQRMILPFGRQVNFGHCLATRNDLLPQALPALVIKPLAQQVVDSRATLPDWHDLLELSHGFLGQHIGAFH